MPGRWKSTRFAVGDKVKYYGRTYEVYRIDWVRGPDRHLKPMYAIQHKFRRHTDGRKFAVTKAWSSGSRLKRAEA